MDSGPRIPGSYTTSLLPMASGFGFVTFTAILRYLAKLGVLAPVALVAPIALHALTLSSSRPTVVQLVPDE